MTPPDLPPLLTGHAAGADPLAEAVAGAMSGRLGAGDLCWSDANGQAAMALVLEPETARDEALQMVPLMAVSLGDALGAVGPPNLGFALRWPVTVLANGGEVGRVTLALPPDTEAKQVPDWLVVGFTMALSLPESLLAAPGEAQHVTALHEEGAGDVDAGLLIAAVARHFLAWLDQWLHEGFAATDAAYRGHLEADPDGELAQALGFGT